MAPRVYWGAPATGSYDGGSVSPEDSLSSGEILLWLVLHQLCTARSTLMQRKIRIRYSGPHCYIWPWGTEDFSAKGQTWPHSQGNQGKAERHSHSPVPTNTSFLRGELIKPSHPGASVFPCRLLSKAWKVCM